MMESAAARTVGFKKVAQWASALVLSVSGAWLLYGLGCQIGILAVPPPTADVARWSSTLAWMGVWWRWLPLTLAGTVAEEVIFRRLVLGAWLLDRMPGHRAVLVSSGIFAIAHLSPQIVLGAFAVGVVLGEGYLRTRSVRWCVVVHFGVNAIAYALRTIQGATQEEAISTVQNASDWRVMFLSGFLGVAAIYGSLRLLDLLGSDEGTGEAPC